MLDIVIAYTCVSQGPIAADYCSRFVGSWIVNPPGVECRLVAVCNGGPPPQEVALTFSPLKCQFFPRQNDEGWDITGYQSAARQFKCDMLVCFGESVYFWKPNWLVPIVKAWEKYGPGFYGFISSFMVRPHLNTTCFVVDPKFLLGYPYCDKPWLRYGLEHGKDSLWSRMQKFRRPTKLVTADGEVYDPPQWRYPKNILWRGDQSNCLVRCNHLDRYDAQDSETKKRWAEGADGLRKLV